MRLLFLSVFLVAALGCSQDVPAQTSDRQATPRQDAATLTPASEAGDRLTFGGRVFDYAGRPLSRAAIVAYQADASGRYNPPGGNTRVPRLRAAAITDDEGRYRFATIRPAAYPDGSEPAHIHLHITAPAHQLRYVTFWFEGDPLLTPALRRRADRDAEIRIVPLAGDASSGWHFEYDIHLEGS